MPGTSSVWCTLTRKGGGFPVLGVPGEAAANGLVDHVSVVRRLTQAP